MKKIIALLCAAIMVLGIVSCADTSVENTDGTEIDNKTDTHLSSNEPDLFTEVEATETEADTETDASEIYTLDGVNILDYVLIVPNDLTSNDMNICKEIREFVHGITGKFMTMKTDDSAEYPYEIIIGKTARQESAALSEKCSNDGFVTEKVGNKIVVLYQNDANVGRAKKYVMKMIMQGTTDVEIEEDMIVTSIGKLRDPCILLVDGVYYAYGTGWHCFKNTSGKLSGKWTDLGVVVDIPKDAETNYWAPEVHEYKGDYYMFTTYKSKASGHRGCVIFKSDSPEGPFVEITNGHITPKDWDSIDGTLYIDEENQPWMVFVHEWTSTDDGIGRMAAAKLSDDFTHFISEPIELFRADDASWCKSQVTDGCWMYRCENGELLMIWSSSDAYGYCVGIARSSNGRLDGEWTHDKELLYSKSMTGQYDGGHGMIFTSIGGQMYLSIHSPNNSGAGRVETPIFLAIKEENGTLVWDR